MDITRVDLAVKSISFTIVRVLLTALMVRPILSQPNYFKLLSATIFLTFGGNILVSALLCKPNVLVTSQWNALILIITSFIAGNDRISRLIGYNRSFEWVRLLTSCFSSGYSMAHTLEDIKSNPIFGFGQEQALTSQFILVILAGGGGGLLYSWLIKGNHFQINGMHIRYITAVAVALMAMHTYGIGRGSERLVASIGIYAFCILESGLSRIKVPGKSTPRDSAATDEKAKPNTPQKRSRHVKTKISESNESPSSAPTPCESPIQAPSESAEPKREDQVEKAIEILEKKVKSPLRTRARAKKMAK